MNYLSFSSHTVFFIAPFASTNTFMRSESAFGCVTTMFNLWKYLSKVRVISSKQITVSPGGVTSLTGN